MYRIISLVIIAACIGATAGCMTDPESAKGFRLPDGDAQNGQELFVELQCTVCHRVSGVELAPPFQSGPVMITLGGTVRAVKTYGELVSSVINPSHKLILALPADEVSSDGESLMKVYNETMTVRQLIDIVAFLQAQYDVVIPAYTYSEYAYRL